MSDQSIHWKFLRTKIGTADDVNWRTSQISPSSIQALVGGTASNGTYSITITGEYTNDRGHRIQVDETISALRDAAETSAQMASELQVAGAANEFLARHGFLVGVSSATLTIQTPPSFRGTFTRVAPGSATITFPIGDTLIPMPAAAIAASGCASVVVSVHAMADTTPLAPNDTFTFSMVPVEVAFYKDPANSLGGLIRRIHVGDAIDDCLLDTDYVIPLRGAHAWTIRLLTNADAADVPATTDRFRVVWREAGVP